MIHDGCSSTAPPGLLREPAFPSSAAGGGDGRTGRPPEKVWDGAGSPGGFTGRRPGPGGEGAEGVGPCRAGTTTTGPREGGTLCPGHNQTTSNTTVPAPHPANTDRTPRHSIGSFCLRGARAMDLRRAFSSSGPWPRLPFRDSTARRAVRNRLRTPPHPLPAGASPMTRRCARVAPPQPASYEKHRGRGTGPTPAGTASHGAALPSIDRPSIALLHSASAREKEPMKGDVPGWRPAVPARR